MASLFIDPGMLASPARNCSLEQFDNYVSHLVKWKELKDCDWASVYISGRTMQMLREENKYPLWDDIKSIIGTYQIDYIQPKDIVNLVDSFLEKFQKIEDALNVLDILFSEHSTDPELSQEGGIREILFETLALMSLKCKLKTESSEDQILISNLTDIDTIKIRSKIELCEFSNGNVIEDNFLIKDEFSCCDSFGKLTLIVNTAALWRICTLTNSYKKIIEMHTLKKIIEAGFELKILSSKFSKDFINSVNELHFNTNDARIKALLDTISEVLSNVNLATTHAIRESEGGDSAQVEYNGYKAWRKDIDREYHLHYWKRGDDIILAKVVPHNDFSITFSVQ